VTGEPSLRLLSRPDCGLCEDAEAALRRLGVPFHLVNIEKDPALEALYGEAVPVLIDGATEIARAPLTEPLLKDILLGRLR
jgi:glutaredoxin